MLDKSAEGLDDTFAAELQRKGVYREPPNGNDRKEVTVNMGEAEIWEGADLVYLREMLKRILDFKEVVILDMSYAKYLPPGTFGLFCEQMDMGRKLQLHNPTKHVRRMLWFQRFTKDMGGDTFQMHTDGGDDSHDGVKQSKKR